MRGAITSQLPLLLKNRIMYSPTAEPPVTMFFMGVKVSGCFLCKSFVKWVTNQCECDIIICV